MSEILSQEEINALFAAMAQEDEVNEGFGASDNSEETIDGDSIKPFDFTRPKSLTIEQRRALEAKHERVAYDLGGALSALLRLGVNVEQDSIEAVLWEAYRGCASGKEILAQFSLPSLDGCVLVEISSELGFAIIERLLGGTGSGAVSVRRMTELEASVVKRVMERVAERVMAHATSEWHPVPGLTQGLDGILVDRQNVRGVSAADTLIVMGMTVRLPSVTGSLRLCIPYDVATTLLGDPKINVETDAPKADRTTQAVSTLEAGLRSVVVPLRVIVGEAEISMQELMELQEGDVIALDTKSSEAFSVIVGSRHAFWAHPVNFGKRLAVEITSKLDAGEEDRRE